MKAWAALLNNPSRGDRIGTVWSTQRAAEAAYVAGTFSVVEIEISDMPREWKVGDWFVNREGDGKQCRIIDMVDDEFAYAFRDWEGSPRADWSGTWMLEEECEPCDPPEWWEGDR